MAMAAKMRARTVLSALSLTAVLAAGRANFHQFDRAQMMPVVLVQRGNCRQVTRLGVGKFVAEHHRDSLAAPHVLA